MQITSVKLIETNAIIITGLLILITFQAISTTGSIIEIHGNQIEKNYIEIAVLQNLFNEKCGVDWREYDDYFPEFLDENSNCKKWHFEIKVLKIENDEMINRIDQLYNSENRKQIPFQLFKNTIIMSKFLLVPFVLSIIIELSMNIRFKNNTNEASKYGLLVMIGGLIMLISVTTIIGLYQNYVKSSP